MRSVLLLAVLFALWGIVGAVEDSFTITVTVEWLDISLRTADDAGDYTNWDLGTVPAGTVDSMTTGSGGNHILVKNNCNVTVDFSAYSTTTVPSCSYGTPTAWTPGTSPGLDTYLLEGGKGDLSTYPTSWTTIDATSAPGNVYASGETPGNDHRFYAKFSTPTSVSDGCQHTITVYIVAQ